MIIALLAATVLMADSTTALQAAPSTTTTAAQPQAAVAATAEQNAKPKKAGNTLVCKTEPVLGTRLPAKRCRTAEQIAAQQQEDQANLDKMQRVGDPGH